MLYFNDIGGGPLEFFHQIAYRWLPGILRFSHKRGFLIYGGLKCFGARFCDSTSCKRAARRSGCCSAGAAIQSGGTEWCGSVSGDIERQNEVVWFCELRYRARKGMRYGP